MKWFKITFSAAQIAGDQLRTLQNQFIEAYMAAEDPRNMALFATASSPNTFYICASMSSAPFANIVVDFFAASPCHKPADEKLTLLAGSAHGIDELLEKTNT